MIQLCLLPLPHGYTLEVQHHVLMPKRDSFPGQTQLVDRRNIFCKPPTSSGKQFLELGFAVLDLPDCTCTSRFGDSDC